MKIIYLSSIIILLFCSSFSISLHAQFYTYNPFEVTYLADKTNVYGNLYINNISGLHTRHGGNILGGSMGNPANMGLIKESFWTIDMRAVHISGNNENYIPFIPCVNCTSIGPPNPLSSFTNTYNDIDISNGNIVYKAPTGKGSFIVGLAYQYPQPYYRYSEINAYNSYNSITDLFADINTDYYDNAFDIYATEYLEVDSEEIGSIFRDGNTCCGPYGGIQQAGFIREKGTWDEATIYGAMEIAKNVFMGASLSYIRAIYTVERNIYEEDINNIYDGTFIDLDDDSTTIGTDIHAINFEERLELRMQGVGLNIGITAMPTSFMEIGLSYKYISPLSIDDIYDYEIKTIFDNGGDLEAVDAFALNYRFNPPQRLYGHVGLHFNKFHVTIASEIVDPSQSSISYNELEYKDEEERVNSDIKDLYHRVFSNYIDISYGTDRYNVYLNGVLKTKTKNIDNNRVYSITAGMSWKLNDTFTLNGSYSWSQTNTESILYETPTVDYNSLLSLESYTKHYVSVGISYNFDINTFDF